MISGVEITELTKQHARELLQLAEKSKMKQYEYQHWHCFSFYSVIFHLFQATLNSVGFGVYVGTRRVKTLDFDKLRKGIGAFLLVSFIVLSMTTPFQNM